VLQLRFEQPKSRTKPGASPLEPAWNIKLYFSKYFMSYIYFNLLQVLEDSHAITM